MADHHLKVGWGPFPWPGEKKRLARANEHATAIASYLEAIEQRDQWGLPANEWDDWTEGAGMRQVDVKKDEVLKRVRENRDKHRGIFEEALENYRAKVIEALEAQLQRARDGVKIAQYLGLEEPEDHTKDYDVVIDMLEMSVDDVITLDTMMFQQYMRDEWPWQQQFLMSNSQYSPTARTEAAGRGYPIQ